MTATLIGRFWVKVDQSGPTRDHRPDLGPCWIWTAALNADGYGRFATPGKRLVQAHRFAYELLVGPIPDGLQLDHLCRVHQCVRPSHLEPVTVRVNLLRGETITAARAAQTSCHLGHPFTETNTYVKPNGTRNCRSCRRDADRRYHQRKRAAA